MVEETTVYDKVGSARLSKSGNALVLVVNNERYVINLRGLLDVINQKQQYVKIVKPSTISTGA